MQSSGADIIRVLFIGDIVGATGREFFAQNISAIKQQHAIDLVVVNGENSSNQGRGITPAVAQFLFEHEVDVITSGNHIWYSRDIYTYLDQNPHIIRPANFPAGAPGSGVAIVKVRGKDVAIVNLQGRVFMKEHLACPLRTIDSMLTYLKDKSSLIFVDYHAEATSEKMALAYYVEGRVSGVVGTHTHIQTADERILPKGTAYITDLGMCGSLNSMLGMQKEAIINHFLTQLPVKFTVDSIPPYLLSGAWIEVDAATGKAIAIERVRVVGEGKLSAALP